MPFITAAEPIAPEQFKTLQKYLRSGTGNYLLCLAQLQRHNWTMPCKQTAWSIQVVTKIS